jgi:hypothetical protein
VHRAKRELINARLPATEEPLAIRHPSQLIQWNRATRMPDPRSQAGGHKETKGERNTGGFAVPLAGIGGRWPPAPRADLEEEEDSTRPRALCLAAL